MTTRMEDLEKELKIIAIEMSKDAKTMDEKKRRELHRKKNEIIAKMEKNK